MAVNMKVTVSQNMMLGSLVGRHQCFRGMYWLHFSFILKLEAARSSAMLATVYIPGDSYLHNLLRSAETPYLWNG
jgi:hypothetical protein